MSNGYHPRLQGTPRLRKLNDYRLRVIRLSMLSAFTQPSSRERQQEVPFKEYHDRVNANLHFEHAQVMGITAKHLLFQMRWFEKRGIMYPKPSSDPDARFNAVIFSDSAKSYFGDKTPEDILTHFETTITEEALDSLSEDLDEDVSGNPQ